MTDQFEEEKAHIRKLGAFLRGSAIVLAGTMGRMLILFITEVIAARLLLPEKYGLITWGLFVVNLLSLVTGLGLNTAIRRYVALYEEERDHQSSVGVIRVSIFLSSIGGLVGGVLLFIGAAWVARHIMGDEREIPILVTLALALPLWNLQKAILAVFSGFKLPSNKVLIEDLLMPIGFLVVVVLAWTMDWKEIPIARGYVAVYLLSVVIGAVLVRTKTPYSKIRWEIPNYRTGKILAFSWPLIFTEPLGKLTGLVDIIIIGSLSTAYDVGTYRVASDLAATMSLVLMSFGFLYLPVISGFVATGDKVSWQDLNARVARWSMLLTFPVFATLFCFPREIINIVYGSVYSEAPRHGRLYGNEPGSGRIYKGSTYGSCG
jgi:O-antigen/teichoic acid export membrane protein